MPPYREVYTDGSRWYIDERTGRRVPSVTSVTSLASPFKGRPGNAAKIGSLVHYHIMKAMAKEPLCLPRDFLWNITDAEVHDKIIAGLLMWRKLDVELSSPMVESVVFDDHYGYAGRIDCVGYDPSGVYTIDELKTGQFYDHYRLQGAAYAKALSAAQVRFIMLDVNRERNPSRVGKIITMGESEIEQSFEEFLSLLRQFIERYKLDSMLTYFQNDL